MLRAAGACIAGARKGRADGVSVAHKTHEDCMHAQRRYHLLDRTDEFRAINERITWHLTEAPVLCENSFAGCDNSGHSSDAVPGLFPRKA